MKKIFILFIACGLCNLAEAQLPAISDLQTTNSPGLILLDKTPASIDKPIDPKTFAISLYNLADGGSLECTPYWLWKHPNYTFKNHLDNRTPILQTLNFSVGTFKDDSILTNVAIGFRTQLYKKYDKETMDAIGKKTKAIQNALIDLEDVNPDFTTINKLAEELTELTSQSRFNIELAGATTGSFLNNNYRNTQWNKFGLWLNMKYTPKNIDCDVIFLARYIQNSNIKTTNFFDVGTSIYYGKNKFEGNLEYIFRLDTDSKKAYDRLSFMLNYKLSNRISLVSSFGRNFNNNANVFTMLGIKFGISGMVIDPTGF